MYLSNATGLPQCGSFGFDTLQYGAYASPGGGKDLATGVEAHSQSQPLSLPQFPGEGALKHKADKWIEIAETRLAGAELLSVARGGNAPAALMVQDRELLPELPQTHRDHEKRVAINYDRVHENAQNAERRYLIEMSARTKLYNIIRACVEPVSVMLAMELHVLCAIAHDGDATGRTSTDRSHGGW